MEWRIKQLIEKLTLLGYCPFEIKSIVEDAVGNDNIVDLSITEESLIIRHLEQYEHLGSLFLLAYSK